LAICDSYESHTYLTKLGVCYLSDETVDVPVPEVVGKDYRLEQISVLYDELLSTGEPFNDP
jgi:hypothetical protein